MTGWTELKLRWRALLHRRQFDRDIEDELAFHLSMRESSIREQNLDVRAGARRRFGNPTRTAERLREMRGWRFAGQLWQDVRYAFRQIRLSPGFAAGAVLPLALAIGCIAAVLTLADAVLFRPTGVRDPGRIAAIYTFSPSQNRYLSDSYADFRDISALSPIESAAAYLRTSISVRLSAGEPAEMRNAELITGDYFHAAGITPALGRPLTPADDQPGAAPVAMIAYSLWESRFAKSPSALGATIQINRLPFTVVGVMPKGYQGMLLDWYPDCSLWVSLQHFNRFYSNALPDLRNRRDMQVLMMLARLAPDASISQLQAALDALAPRIAAPAGDRFIAFPSTGARFFPAYRDGTLHFLWMLIAVSAAAVAIACFNLASLLLARAAARRQEVATRLAIGAGRFQILQQFLVENTVLALSAGALSIPIALGAAAWLRDAPVMQGFTMQLDLSPDPRALALGMLAGILTALAAGIAPALKSSRGDLRPSRSPAASRDLFIALQIACVMAILAPAALLLQNLRTQVRTPLGYDTGGILLASTALEPLDTFAVPLLTKLRDLAPQSALASYALPTVMRSSLTVRTDASDAWTPVSFNWVSDGYFELLHIPLLSGRSILASDDRLAAPVVVVNRAAAARLWPGRNPVGRHLRLRSEPADREVIGVVEDIRIRPLGRPAAPEPYLFLPLFQNAGRSALNIHIRAAGSPLQLIDALRQMCAKLDPDSPVSDIRTLDQQVESGLKPMQLAAEAAGAVSALGLLLAVAGMFAAAAYRVVQQKKEIAIRIAIGADPRRVILGFAMRGLWIGLAGACLGQMPSVWGVALLRSSIPGVEASTVWLHAAGAAVLVLAAAAAALAASSRIAKVDPAGVLRVQ